MQKSFTPLIHGCAHIWEYIKKMLSEMRGLRTLLTRSYWSDALTQLKDTRMLILAALVVAMRVAVRSLSIPIAENLFISIEFLPVALGAVVYGPFVSLLVGAVCDVLGALLFPRGPYFPPFMLVSMASAFLFAIFLHQAPPNPLRALLAKASVNLVCNIVLTPIMLAWLYGDAAYLISLTRVIKNITLLPLETALLFALLKAMWPVLSRMRLIRRDAYAK